MTWPVPPGALLDGPRGRRLCWELVRSAVSAASDWSEYERLWSAAQRGDLSGVAGELAGYAADLGQGLPGEDDARLLSALADVTTAAMYWQEPDPEDIALEDPAARAALLPVAEALGHDLRTAWWSGPMEPASQQVVRRQVAHPAALSGTRAALARWRADTAEDERRAAGRPRDPAAPWSGYWWSTPAMAGLPETARTLPGLGPVGLALVEDPLGWEDARCQPVRPVAAAHCYEVTGPDRWAELAGRYPFEVTNSRRHDWWRATGWAGPWLMPDYAAVAADYDAVHLTVLGYLTTAGVAVPVGQQGARTVLAGWAPDATYWLSDVLSESGPATKWAAHDGDPLWTQVT